MIALGFLAWITISDQRIRLVTLAILAMFALKTWVRRKDVLHPGKKSRDVACYVSCCRQLADVAQLVEHSLGKGEVISSILIIGSRIWCERRSRADERFAELTADSGWRE